MKHFHLLATFCWATVACVLGVSTQEAEVAANANATGFHFNFLHVFTTETNGSVNETLRDAQSVLVDSKPQFIMVTTPETAGTNPSVSTNESQGALADLTPLYAFTGDNRIGFSTSQWQVERDMHGNGSVWTHLASSNSQMLDVCAVVVLDVPTTAQQLIQLTTSVSTFCSTQDIVLVGFTSPLAKDLALYLEAKTTLNGQYVPRIMKEVVAFAQQNNNSTQLADASASNRLFAAFPATTYLENATGAAMPAGNASVQRVDVCVGDGCPASTQLPSADEPATMESHESSVKRGLVVLLSCGTFFIGCALVFYVFFRKQFFLPSESTKPEKDLTTNLAYVLRM